MRFVVIIESRRHIGVEQYRCSYEHNQNQYAFPSIDRGAPGHRLECQKRKPEKTEYPPCAQNNDDQNYEEVAAVKHPCVQEYRRQQDCEQARKHPAAEEVGPCD